MNHQGSINIYLKTSLTLVFLCNNYNQETPAVNQYVYKFGLHGKREKIMSKVDKLIEDNEKTMKEIVKISSNYLERRKFIHRIISIHIWHGREQEYKSSEELIQTIEEYMEYYNNIRIVSKHKLSPIEYRNQFLKGIIITILTSTL